MGLLIRSIESLPLIGKALIGTGTQVSRLPLSPTGYFVSPFYGSTGEAGREHNLSQMATSPWLFSVIDRIASSVSSVEWRMVEKMRDGGEQEISEQPAQVLWNRPSRFTTRGELLEAGIQYFELLGEIPLIVLRDSRGVPAELQLVRPTRIFPVPSREDYLAGYLYKVGVETIPLAVEDVIFIRRPNPINEYRGLGVVQSLLIDLGSEDAAARWMRSFFRNSAMPGGVIEVDGTLDQSTFERYRAQWAEHHQGVSNAHRVAILENGHWKDAAFTQRDMQFEQLRKLSRDLILGAFGMPMSALGIVESVNRANAEAGEILFSRWVIRPRLERIAGELNEGLLPLFPGTEHMAFRFIDPTPADRVQDLQESTQGYTSGLLTLNEARAGLGKPAVDGGDEFKPPAPSPFGLGFGETPEVMRYALSSGKSVRVAEAPGLTLEEFERRWAQRFEQELDGLIAHLEGLSKAYWQKLELLDVATWNWDWWAKWGPVVVRELADLFTLGLMGEFPDMPEANVTHLAAMWAEQRGASLLKLDGDLSLANATRERVRQLTAETIEQGKGIKDLVKQLRIDPGFSKERATLVARTETAVALGQGQKQAAIAQEKTEKRWKTQGDALVRPTHRQNEAAGWIPIADLFPDGEDTISEFNCRCKVTYRTTYPDEEHSTGEHRDPAGHLLSKNGKVFCRKCKAEYPVK